MTLETLEPRLHLTTAATFTASHFPGLVRVGEVVVRFRHGDILVNGRDVGDARGTAKIAMQFTAGKCSVFADGKPLVTVKAPEPAYGDYIWRKVHVEHWVFAKAAI